MIILMTQWSIAASQSFQYNISCWIDSPSIGWSAWDCWGFIKTLFFLFSAKSAFFIPFFFWNYLIIRFQVSWLPFIFISLLLLLLIFESYHLEKYILILQIININFTKTHAYNKFYYLIFSWLTDLKNRKNMHFYRTVYIWAL